MRKDQTEKKLTSIEINLLYIHPIVHPFKSAVHQHFPVKVTDIMSFQDILHFHSAA